MIIAINEIDSIVFGKNVLEIQNISADIDFQTFENEYIHKFKPLYVSCKIPVEEIENIHFLEKQNFSFVEFQLREVLRLKESYKPVTFYPYKLELITSPDDLNRVLEIAATTFKHDRFSADPLLLTTKSGERYQKYVRKSHETQDEFVYKLINTNTNEILGFKTHKIVSENEALMFLGGILNQYKKTPLPVISNYLELNELFAKGIRKITSHISGSNYGVINLELKEFGYKVTQAFVILRKIYGD